MSREQARRLVGRVLQLPETRRPLPIRLKIIRVVVDETEPQHVVVHAIRIDASGREAEGRTIVLTPADIADHLEWPSSDHSRK
jgi:hypothetical protein